MQLSHYVGLHYLLLHISFQKLNVLNVAISKNKSIVTRSIGYQLRVNVATNPLLNYHRALHQHWSLSLNLSQFQSMLADVKDSIDDDEYLAIYYLLAINALPNKLKLIMYKVKDIQGILYSAYTAVFIAYQNNFKSSLQSVNNHTHETLSHPYYNIRIHLFPTTINDDDNNQIKKKTIIINNQNNHNHNTKSI